MPKLPIGEGIIPLQICFEMLFGGQIGQIQLLFLRIGKTVIEKHRVSYLFLHEVVKGKF